MSSITIGSKECPYKDVVKCLMDSSELLYDEWQNLARELNLSSVRLLKIKKDLAKGGIPFREAIHQLVVTWHTESDSNATVAVLADALDVCDLASVAVELRKRFGGTPQSKRGCGGEVKYTFGNIDWDYDDVIDTFRTSKEYGVLIQRWLEVAAKLGVPVDVVERVRIQLLTGQITHPVAFRELLMHWRSKEGKSATLDVLASALKSCELRGVADELASRYST